MPGAGTGTHGGSGHRDREAQEETEQRPRAPAAGAGAGGSLAHLGCAGSSLAERNVHGPVCPRGAEQPARRASGNSDTPDRGDRGVWPSAPRLLQSVNDEHPGESAFKGQTVTLRGNVHRDPLRTASPACPNAVQATGCPHRRACSRLGRVCAQRRASPGPYRRRRRLRAPARAPTQALPSAQTPGRTGARPLEQLLLTR